MKRIGFIAFTFTCIAIALGTGFLLGRNEFRNACEQVIRDKGIGFTLPYNACDWDVSRNTAISSTFSTFEEEGLVRPFITNYAYNFTKENATVNFSAVLVASEGTIAGFKNPVELVSVAGSELVIVSTDNGLVVGETVDCDRIPAAQITTPDHDICVRTFVRSIATNQLFQVTAEGDIDSIQTLLEGII